MKFRVFKAVFFFAILAFFAGTGFAGEAEVVPAYSPKITGISKPQYASFPKPLALYESSKKSPQEAKNQSIAEILQERMSEPFNLVATGIFLLAIFHTFLAAKIQKIAHKAEAVHQKELAEKNRDNPQAEQAVPPVSFKAVILHFLGEVEVVFGLWVVPLMIAAAGFFGLSQFRLYVGHDCNFTEAIFVVVIMAISASRPIVRFAENCMGSVARLGGGTPGAWWLSILTLAPLLGSLITEPAAMTIAAMLLARRFYKLNPSKNLAYGTLGLLFVNISVGGTLTNFAAPPVLMVASKWNWDSTFMLSHFGGRAVGAVLLSNLVYFLIFRKEFFAMRDRADGVPDQKFEPEKWERTRHPVPIWVTAGHLFFLVWTVFSAHDVALFVGGFLFFLAFVAATDHLQNRIALRSPLLVGFFLAGLVIHGGCQAWWIEPIITKLSAQMVMFGSVILTAFNDNAAITYLASTVPNLSDAMKHAVVAGAITGGGLTVIANAPNPAGQAILGRFFENALNPCLLLLGALVPTIITYCFFLF